MSVPRRRVSATVSPAPYRLNSSPSVVEQLNNMPIKIVNGALVYIGDVANVRDGAGVQTNIVRQNGHAGTYLSVLKNGNALFPGGRLRRKKGIMLNQLFRPMQWS